MSDGKINATVEDVTIERAIGNKVTLSFGDGIRITMPRDKAAALGRALVSFEQDGKSVRELMHQTW